MIHCDQVHFLALGGIELTLLTIGDLSRRLKIPASTVRYYRDHVSDFLPSIGSGKTRRYYPEAVEVLQDVIDEVRKGIPLSAIREQLESDSKLQASDRYEGIPVRMAVDRDVLQEIVNLSTKIDALQTKLDLVLKNVDNMRDMALTDKLRDRGKKRRLF